MKNVGVAQLQKQKDESVFANVIKSVRRVGPEISARNRWSDII